MQRLSGQPEASWEKRQGRHDVATHRLREKDDDSSFSSASHARHARDDQNNQHKMSLTPDASNPAVTDPNKRIGDVLAKDHSDVIRPGAHAAWSLAAAGWCALLSGDAEPDEG